MLVLLVLDIVNYCLGSRGWSKGNCAVNSTKSTVRCPGGTNWNCTEWETHTATPELASRDKHLPRVARACSAVRLVAARWLQCVWKRGCVRVFQTLPCFIPVRCFQTALCPGRLFKWIWKMLSGKGSLLAGRNFQADSVWVFKAVWLLHIFFFNEYMQIRDRSPR